MYVHICACHVHNYQCCYIANSLIQTVYANYKIFCLILQCSKALPLTYVAISIIITVISISSLPVLPEQPAQASPIAIQPLPDADQQQGGVYQVPPTADNKNDLVDTDDGMCNVLLWSKV